MCTEERKPHKHAAVIKAWADGATIQYLSSWDDRWHDVVDNKPIWAEHEYYRAKPAPKRTAGYRRYIYRSCNGDYRMSALSEGDDYLTPKKVWSEPSFVRWIDTEWQYYEWEE